MPQIFQVLRCYKCLVFQIHQTKKSNKFQCKMCGEKQSIKRHYGIGNGKECRVHVQKLNAIKGQTDELKNATESFSDSENEIPSKPIVCKIQTKKHSKWSNFVEAEESKDTQDPSDNTMYLNDKEVVLELPRKRQKTLLRFSNNRKAQKQLNKSDSEENDHREDSFYIQTHRCKTDKLNTFKCNSKRQSFDNRSLASSNINLETSPQKIPTNHTNNNNVKLSHFENTELSVDPREIEIISENISPKKAKASKFIPPSINKNSKWATFAEDSDENDINMCSQNDEHKIHSFSVGSQEELEQIRSNYNHLLIEHPKKAEGARAEQETQMLFSLCNDDELDNYLDI